MTATVTFRNPGTIDPVAITTFGVNAKDCDNPIGYFGTGLKYAIAVILRLGGKITIHSAGDTYEFGIASHDVRGKTFDVVCMNGKPLGFTTELGKNWGAWQAFRELYCNALDEGGGVSDAPNSQDIADDETVITVVSAEFRKCYIGRRKIVLDTTPIHRTEGVAAVHDGSSGYVYYRGVRIYDGFYPSIFTYDIEREIDITEDRTAKYTFQLKDAIADAAVTCTDTGVIEAILTASRDTLERHSLDFSDLRVTPSEAFFEVATALRYHASCNPTVSKMLARYDRLPHPGEAELDVVQKKTLSRAVNFCRRIGYAVDTYPITVSQDLMGGMHGMADMRAKRIYLSVNAFEHGTKYIASTLLEEYIHLSTGYQDTTRELQTHLFNQIITLGERLVGEPA